MGQVIQHVVGMAVFDIDAIRKDVDQRAQQVAFICQRLLSMMT